MEEYQDLPLKNFCLLVPKLSVTESFTIALISDIEKVWIRVGLGEYQDFLSKCLCLTVSKIFVGEPFFAVFQEVSVSQRTLDNKEGGVACQDFPSKFFCLPESQISVGESFKVPLLSGIERMWITGWGGVVSKFSVENFCLTVPKFSLRESSAVALISGIRKIRKTVGGMEGVSNFSVAKFSCINADTFRNGILY